MILSEYPEGEKEKHIMRCKVVFSLTKQLCTYIGVLTYSCKRLDLNELLGLEKWVFVIYVGGSVFLSVWRLIFRVFDSRMQNEGNPCVYWRIHAARADRQ
ncbi:hypothetical protein POTOM_036692 [Populus tomentosa]|uniref:Uncharacterized protein n=1 Tax=Populus tomentosa TaxID=118781 RepID=A0A8X8CND0_POPTO|nr:hypothetical protein POTOM_036692 [Populus tomentosa]